MDDFKPGNIVDQVPELKRLQELRESLNSLKGPLVNIPEFRKKLQSLVKDKETREKILKEMGIGEEGG
jgi:type VI secretion system protein ImpB